MRARESFLLLVVERVEMSRDASPPPPVKWYLTPEACSSDPYLGPQEACEKSAFQKQVFPNLVVVVEPSDQANSVSLLFLSNRRYARGL